MNLGTTTLETMILMTKHRSDGFRYMANRLLKINSPLIVETGCARWHNNFEGDGMSTLIWDSIANQTNGQVITVDLSKDSVEYCKSQVSNKTIIHCADSVPFLQNLENTLLDTNQFIDLLYLDSYDIDFDNPHNSSLHHIFELLSIKKVLRPGSIVAVDDNIEHKGTWVGKGLYVAEWMQQLNKRKVYNGYQWIWEW